MTEQNGRGAELWTALDAADTRVAAVEAEADAAGLTPAEWDIWHNRGGKVWEAKRDRQDAADQVWRYHEGPDATAEEVAEFIRRTGRPPHARDADARQRNLVAKALCAAADREAAAYSDAITRVVTGLGHDPADPRVIAVVDQALAPWHNGGTTNT